MPAIPTYTFFGWNNAYSYDKWDVVIDTSVTPTQYFYSTVGTNVGANPNSTFVYSPTLSTRTDNVMRLSFTQTGTTYFQQGSVVVISGLAPDAANYTGLALAGGPGYVDYLNPGLNTSNVVTAGGVRAPIHPYWTTGFYWIPSWSTEVTHNMEVVTAKLGEGYSQRFNPVINSNSLSWNLVFAERTDKETMGMLTFLQVQGGATPFVLDFPVGRLFNKPGLRYISQPLRDGLTSFGLNATSFVATQVFDIG